MAIVFLEEDCRQYQYEWRAYNALWTQFRSMSNSRSIRISTFGRLRVKRSNCEETTIKN